MGLKELIKEELKSMEHEKKTIKEKKFKFPFGKKVGRSQRKKNYITILNLKENGTYDYKKYQITDQTFIHEKIPRLAAAGHVMFDKKGHPLVILPEWSIEPFSPQKHFFESMEAGSNTKGYKLLLARMEQAKTDEKKKMGGIAKWAIGLVVLGIIAFALLSGGGS